jgi:hypothetical protein
MDTDYAEQVELNVRHITLSVQNKNSINNNNFITALNRNIEKFYQEPLITFIAGIESKNSEYVEYINKDKEVVAVHQLKDDLKNFLSCAQTNSEQWHSFFDLLSDQEERNKTTVKNDEFSQKIFELLQKKHEKVANNHSQPLAPTVSKASMAVKIVKHCPGLSQAIAWGTKNDNQMVSSLLSLVCSEQTYKNITTQYFPVIQAICSKNGADTIAQTVDDFLNAPVIKETIDIACTTMDSKPIVNQYNMLQKHTLIILLEKMSSAYEEAKSMPTTTITEDSTDVYEFYSFEDEEEEEEVVVGRDNNNSEALNNNSGGDKTIINISESNGDESSDAEDNSDKVLKNDNSDEKDVSDEKNINNNSSESNSNENNALNNGNDSSKSSIHVKKSSLISQILYRLGDIINKNKKILFISISCLAIMYISHKIGVNNLILLNGSSI